MNILVIGGTRLLGLSLVRQLNTTGHKITVLSRHPLHQNNNCRTIVMDRQNGLNILQGEKFDLVFDFLAYDDTAVNEVERKLTVDIYVLISSAWMTKLGFNFLANQIIIHPEEEALARLSKITLQYLLGKQRAELAAITSRTFQSLIVRMPIFWGEHEHTGRINFYSTRLEDGNPLILVDGGYNLTQIAWTEDLASAMIANIPLLTRSSCPQILEGIPHNGITTRDVITIIAKGLDKIPIFAKIEKSILSKYIPEYLAAEPLWREEPIGQTETNLFRLAQMKPTDERIWLTSCSPHAKGDPQIALRARELSFMREFKTC